MLWFTHDGLLPQGIHALRFEELRRSPLVTGEGVRGSRWVSAWRRHLVDNLETLTRQLWAVGVEEVYADGSFAEATGHPNDIDGYFPVAAERIDSGELERELNRLDPHRCWTWLPGMRRTDGRFSKPQLPMWHHYRVELYPHVPGRPSGITDQAGNPLGFPDAFTRTRDHRPRGILKLLSGLT